MSKFGNIFIRISRKIEYLSNSNHLIKNLPQKYVSQSNFARSEQTKNSKQTDISTSFSRRNKTIEATIVKGFQNHKSPIVERLNPVSSHLPDQWFFPVVEVSPGYIYIYISKTILSSKGPMKSNSFSHRG